MIPVLKLCPYKKGANTWLYWQIAKLIKSAIEIIFRFSHFAKCCSIGNKAMEPSSSSTILQRTAAGVHPANVARSTDASVCPALFSTPPSPKFKRKNMPLSPLRKMKVSPATSLLELTNTLQPLCRRCLQVVHERCGRSAIPCHADPLPRAPGCGGD